MAAQGTSPSGQLFFLPRELRNKVYRVLFNKTYLVYGHPFYHIDPYRKPKSKVQADLALLRTCKVIFEEGTAVLYSTAVFRFAIDYFEAKPPPSLPKVLTDRMMNVDFILNQASFDDGTRNDFPDVSPSKLRRPIKAIMRRFAGDKISRRTCGVLLWAVEFDSTENDFLSSPMVSALQSMTGFASVTIEVEDQNLSLAHQRARNEEEGESEEGGSEASYQSSVEFNTGDTRQQVEVEGITNCTGAFTQQISEALKGTLGAGKIAPMVNRPGVANQSVKFFPRKHMTTQ